MIVCKTEGLDPLAQDTTLLLSSVQSVLGERYPSPPKMGQHFSVPKNILYYLQAINSYEYRLLLGKSFEFSKILDSGPRPDAITTHKPGDRSIIAQITLIPCGLLTAEHDQADTTHSSVFSHKASSIQGFATNIFMLKALIKGNLTLASSSRGAAGGMQPAPQPPWHPRVL